MSEMKRVFEKLSPENQKILLMTAHGMEIAQEEATKLIKEEANARSD